jgi:hypothetical protein
MLSPVNLIAGNLCVRFDRRNDRIEHSIWASNCEIPLLVSLESEGDPAWPSSPPFQELTLETRGDRQIALLVGKAGTSHWSASVEPSAETGQIAFDVACRVQQPPGWLGNRYRIPAAARVELLDRTINIVNGGEILNIAGSASSETLSVCEAVNSGVAVTASNVAKPLPSTIRWRYSLQRILSPRLFA